MASSIYDVLGIIADLEDKLNENTHNKRDAILSHLKKMDILHFRSPEFNKDLDWLNVAQPIKIHEQLKGKIVVLDFFTYCCINCLHILPDLAIIEEKFPLEAGVVVVGVHSAKFQNEKVTSNILSAVLRYNISHPVVNDKNATLWQELAVSCWPTLVFLGPKGHLIYSIAGEGHRDKILLFLEVATQHYSAELSPGLLPILLERDRAKLSALKFPGKVCYWPEQKCPVIADTGNNRIVVTDLNGIVQFVVGSGCRGLKDGTFESAELSSPQGVTCDAHNIYVADTGNHCIRKINFDNFSVTTIAGTGHQGSDKKGGKQFEKQELSSPWDVLIAESPHGSSPVLFIAMAGSHQIWVYFLTDTVWFNKSYLAGTCLHFAGTGLEENRNNSYPEKASFAQPSGLALSNNKLYIADSESSSIRCISLADSKVTGIVGGERDPMNLFAFGDVDGRSYNAKLQHPLGVAVLGDTLMIADSYNHRVKTVDLQTLMCESLVGTGQPGSLMVSNDLRLSELNEPGGVCVNTRDSLVYIADTNNHVIKVVNMLNKTISKLPIIFSSEEQDNDFPTKETTSDWINLPDTVWSKVTGGTLSLSLPLHLSEDEFINTEAPNSWVVAGSDEESEKKLSLLEQRDRKGRLDHSPDSKEALMTLKLPTLNQKLTLKISAQLFICNHKTNACLPPKWLHFKQTVF